MTDDDMSTAIYLVLIAVLLAIIAFFLFRKKPKSAKIAKELVKEKERVEKEEKRKIKLVHNVVLYESFFIIGVIISIIGYLIRNWFVIIIGVVAMLLSLPLLQIVLKKKLEEDPEEVILRRAEELIKKENKLAKKEKAIRKQIDELYNKAIRLMAVEKEVEALRKKANLPENDVKKVLKTVDELLEKLPDEEIEKFLKSEDFKLYQRVMKGVK